MNSKWKFTIAVPVNSINEKINQKCRKIFNRTFKEHKYGLGINCSYDWSCGIFRIRSFKEI